jgi:hypothetical protein
MSFFSPFVYLFFENVSSTTVLLPHSKRALWNLQALVVRFGREIGLPEQAISLAFPWSGWVVSNATIW